jgi:hypothetical protein
MATLDDFFSKPVEATTHPRLRDWQRRIQQPGVKTELELYRTPSALGLAQTEMNLHFTIDGEPQPIETVVWDDDLNAGLVQLKVRALDLDQEAERFALALRGALRKAEREFGDGYLNAVLLALIKDSDLTRYSEIDEVVRHTYGNPPESTRRHDDCRKMIANEIGARAHELKERLDYKDDEAKDILVKAIARYLDERFSVSSRRRMGLL